MTATILANGTAHPGMAVAARLLQQRSAPLNVVESAIRLVELDPSVRSVGIGGAPNILGEMELDASVMDGNTLQSGAVGALTGYPHPISVARKVMEKLPHVILVGNGAARFAREEGFETSEVLSGEAKSDYESWLRSHLPPEVLSRWPDVPLAQPIWESAKAKPGGTVCFLVADENGNMAGGVSTSGWAYKYPGRLGDSSIIGAGLYVDSRYGAAGCTHTGEMSIRAGTARSVVLYMKKGASVKDACHEAIDDLRALKGGFIGQLVIYAMTPQGETFVAAINTAKESSYFHWQESSSLRNLEAVEFPA